MRKRSCHEGGEGKSGLDENGPNALVATALNKGRAAIESVSARSAKNFGPIFWVHVHLHIREVSGDTPPLPSEVKRPEPPLPPRFRRPCTII